MSNIIIAADVHCGIKGKLEHCLWAMCAIREYAKNNHIDTIIIIGDLFHDRVNLNIKVIGDVADFLDETRHSYNQEWVVFPGNHDMFMRHSWNVNSLRPIKRLITLIDDVALIKIEDRKFRIIPFIQKEETYMKVLNRINEKANDDEILLTHAGIVGAKYNACFLIQHWGLVDFEGTKFSRVFAGHFHCYQEIGKVIVPGSPIPFRFDEGMVSHGFVVLDLVTNDASFVDISIGKKMIGGSQPPDYVTVFEDQLDGFDATNKHIRVVLTKTRSRDELERIRSDLEANGAIKVAWMKREDPEIDMPQQNATMEPSTLLEKFIDYDKPSLNRQLLLSLNKQILDEAFELEPENTDSE